MEAKRNGYMTTPIYEGWGRQKRYVLILTAEKRKEIVDVIFTHCLEYLIRLP